jgi:hypothetical protein
MPKHDTAAGYGPLGFSLALAGICLTLMAADNHAAAQSCHSPSLRPSEGLTWRAALTGTFGNFSDGANRGEYQGYFATLAVSHPWFSAEISLPTYRLAQIGSHAYGLGDLALAARANAYRSRDDSLIAGPEITTTLPTGAEEKQLGMGHVMLMPGGFLRWQHAGITLIAQLAYGRALQPSGHVHVDPTPIVNPMNRSELSHAIGASAPIHENLRLTGRLFGAVPLFDHAGAAREIIAPGLQVIAGAFDAGLELQLPVVGKPFDTRTVFSLGAQW